MRVWALASCGGLLALSACSSDQSAPTSTQADSPAGTDASQVDALSQREVALSPSVAEPETNNGIVLPGVDVPQRRPAGSGRGSVAAPPQAQSSELLRTRLDRIRAQRAQLVAKTGATAISGTLPQPQVAGATKPTTTEVVVHPSLPKPNSPLPGLTAATPNAVGAPTVPVDLPAPTVPQPGAASNTSPNVSNHAVPLARIDSPGGNAEDLRSPTLQAASPPRSASADVADPRRHLHHSRSSNISLEPDQAVAVAIHGRGHSGSLEPVVSEADPALASAEADHRGEIAAVRQDQAPTQRPQSSISARVQPAPTQGTLRPQFSDGASVGHSLDAETDSPKEGPAAGAEAVNQADVPDSDSNPDTWVRSQNPTHGHGAEGHVSHAPLSLPLHTTEAGRIATPVTDDVDATAAEPHDRSGAIDRAGDPLEPTDKTAPTVSPDAVRRHQVGAAASFHSPEIQLTPSTPQPGVQPTDAGGSVSHRQGAEVSELAPLLPGEISPDLSVSAGDAALGGQAPQPQAKDLCGLGGASAIGGAKPPPLVTAGALLPTESQNQAAAIPEDHQRGTLSRSKTCSGATKPLAQMIPDAATAGTPIPGMVESPTR